jgi:HlyD family secretion protein
MDAYPGRTFRGGVYMLSPVVTGSEREARTFLVRIRIEDSPAGQGFEPDPVIKPGMSADVEIVVDTLRNALVLPVQAVFERKDGNYVYVLKGSRAALRKVKTGRSSFDYVEIASGVREGEEVVTNPDAAGLRDGARIKRAS